MVGFIKKANFKSIVNKYYRKNGGDLFLGIKSRVELGNICNKYRCIDYFSRSEMVGMI